MKVQNDLWHTVLNGLQTTYAFLDDHGLITEHNAQFAAWSSMETQDLVGMQVLDVLPEFFGQEEEFQRVYQQEIPYLQLENINRVQSSGETCYFTITVIPYARRKQTALAVLVTDVTKQGEYLQALTQNRNELRLVRGQLFQLNEQLDLLLRHYLPTEVANALVKGELRPELGGDLRQVTVLFTDVRNFTALAETLSPESVMVLLNDYMQIVAEAIHQHGGTINQFQGDSMMVIFNAPLDQFDHATRAVKAGIALQQALLDYQAQQPSDKQPLYFGVGINTGSAVVGNCGARWRYTYTAIGDTVNLASRITAATPAGQIWLSQATYEQLQERFTLDPLPAIVFKGKRKSTSLYRVIY